MTDAQRLAKIREACRDGLADAKSIPEDQFMAGVYYSFGKILDILESQPDPHPLGSVRFDEATEEQFREFWEAAGFVIESDYAERYLVGDRVNLTIFQYGQAFMCDDCDDIEMLLNYFPTFQEALDALNELAATKIMGGWA
jgi:hypothetical protein